MPHPSFRTPVKACSLLKGARILLVEDEPMISMALGFAIEDAGGVVVGPSASVRAALAMLAEEKIEAAILDVNLPDGIISPVVEHLVQHDTPFILQTGVDIPPDLAARFPDLVVRIKPSHPDRLIAELARMIARH